MIIRTVLFASAFAFVPSSQASAQAVVGGFAAGYADPGADQVDIDRKAVVLTTGALGSVQVGQPGAGVATRSRSAAWTNKVEILGDSTPGSIVVGTGMSVFGVNQVVNGEPGTKALVNYNLRVDGSFTLGNPIGFPPPQFALQDLTFYFIAYRGKALEIRETTEHGAYDLLFDSTTGQSSLWLAPGMPGYQSNNDDIIGFASLCPFRPVMSRCTQGGTFDDLVSISFEVEVGQDYHVVGYLRGQTNGTLAFFNTARLETIFVEEGYELFSDDGGALVRNPDGSYGLPRVPEPATWLMLISGFGLVGWAARRRPMAPVSS